MNVWELIKKANGDEPKGEVETGGAPSEAQILKFFDRHPRPLDKHFHAWAERNGFNPHKAEEVAYKVLSDLINTGRSKGRMPSGVREQDIREGMKIEKEHTKNPILRRKISADHLREFKRYYRKREGLPALEKALEKKAATDVISMDVPLFIRMLEWAHEDAKTDMQLHQATKNLLSMKGPLTMLHYNAAVGGSGMPPIPSAMGKKACAESRKTHPLLKKLREKK